jgi:single-strand DNA-binding protein
MNSIRNRVQLIGNLGSNPEVKELEGGKKVVRFSLATNDAYKNEQGEKVKETIWHNLVAWGKTAESVGRLLKKGSELVVEGKLVTRSYQDKDGTKRYITEVIVLDYTLIGGKKTQTA